MSEYLHDAKLLSSHKIILLSSHKGALYHDYLKKKKTPKALKENERNFWNSD